MDNPINMESLTNSLVVLQKLKQLHSPQHRDENDNSAGTVYPDRLTLMQEIFKVIEGFMPQTRGGTFGLAFRQGSRYSGAYRDLKSHIRNMGRSKPEMQHVMKTLKLVAPVLDNRQKVYMDKFIKIIDIIQS